MLKRDSAEVCAREDILFGLVQSLSEVKHSKTKAYLITKHAILTTIVSTCLQCSIQFNACLLGVHKRNMVTTM